MPIPTIELRWVRRPETTTQLDRLQFRVTEFSNTGVIIAQDWTDVPVIVVE